MNKMINQRNHREALFDNFILTSLKKQKKPIELPIVKSPLRYPGGKSRAVPMIINNYIRKQKTLCSPFVGGGSIELTLAKIGTKVYAYDAFKPLVIFWQMLLKDASALAEKVREYEDMTPAMFYNLQKTFGSIKNQLEIAAVFFALNRSSFSGTTLSGGMSLGYPRFNYRSIERLKDFRLKILQWNTEILQKVFLNTLMIFFIMLLHILLIKSFTVKKAINIILLIIKLLLNF